MSELGKARRKSHLFDKISKRMFCVPIDHGMQVGPLPGLEDPGPLIDKFVDAGVNAVIVNPGTLARYGRRFTGGPAVILRLDQTTMWRHSTRTGYPDTHNRLVASVEDALQMGAEAVITYLFTCNQQPELESRSFEICGQVASECRRWGVVHVIEAMAANGGFAKRDDPDIIAMNCRMAGELGADIIKTDWCDADRFKIIANQSIAPVAVAGGSALPKLSDTIQFAESAIAAGACGLFFGRNIFTRPDVATVLTEIGQAVHAGPLRTMSSSNAPGISREN